MINKNGMIIFSSYKQLEKDHGADNAIGIINEISNRLDKKGILYNQRHTDSQVKAFAIEEYEKILMELKDETFVLPEAK